MGVKPKEIVIKGAKMHNLKNIDVCIPTGKLSVVTGVSGSGKSSLVFDTLYAEGQRRYVESLSAYARQFLGRLDKPEVESISGLAPAIAIEQKVNTRNPRSTVATSTEIYDYLKLLFSRIGRTYSPISNTEVKKHTTEDVVTFCKSLPENTSFLVLSRINNDLKTELQKYKQQGFVRVLSNGEIVKIENLQNKIPSKHQTYLIIDRLNNDTSDIDFETRLSDSVESAFWEGMGNMYIQLTNDNAAIYEFSNKFEADGIAFEIPTQEFLSFNNPHGACKTCEGYGLVIGIDEDLVIPDKSLSIYDDAVAPWKGETMSEWKKQFMTNAIDFDYPIHRAYSDLNQEQKKLLWEGNKKVDGIQQFFTWVEEKSYKIQYRVLLSRYRGKTTCTECRGTRLRKDAEYVKIQNTNIKTPEFATSSIADILLMTVSRALQYFESIQLNEHDFKIANRIVTEIKSRLHFLNEVGLGYLQLNRLSNSLSGGESQRINLATSLGSTLTGSLYILDEPSIGLHPKDTTKLINVLKELRDIGNTVIVVEHEEEMMKSADRLIDIGPFAGAKGGNLIFNGTYSDILNHNDSLTGKYLSGKEKINIPSKRRKGRNSIKIEGARENNLKNLNVSFPLETIIAVTGVSGSGKTTLVKTVLYPALQKVKGNYSGTKTGKHDKITGDLHLIKSVELVDQNPIGKSSRSNPVTYVKAYDAIRDLFSGLNVSKAKKLKPQHFSFNVDGGRCDHCKGEGEVTIEMQFMADLTLPCEFCKGKRFKDEILEVEYKGKNISDVLQLTVSEAIDFFSSEKTIVNRLEPLEKVGLGYVKMGQSSNTLSGGEAQRIKLASFLSKGGNKSDPCLFIFDEPTTGLHFHDINKLIFSFQALVDQGHTIIVIEHNTEVIKCADWIIDLGPEGGDNGGNVVFEGIPEELINCERSFTGKYLKGKL